jgi:glyoxylate reductase
MEKPLVLSTIDLSPRTRSMVEVCGHLSPLSGRACTYEQAIRAAPDVVGILCSPQLTIDATLLREARRLRVVSTYGVGTDHVDVPEATTRGVFVTNTAGANTNAVAEIAFGLILALGRCMFPAAELVRGNGWDRLDVVPVVPGIDGSVLGIIGFGRIGRAVARRGLAFEMKVIYNDIVDVPVDPSLPAIPVPLEELLSTADFVSVHANLHEGTRHLLDRKRLALMKPGAYLINTARGGVVDQEALYDALESGIIAGAGLDVLEEEPPPPHEPLLQHPGAIVLPHIGASTRSARRRMAESAIDNLLAGLRGEIPADAMNPEAVDFRPNVPVTRTGEP